MNDINSIIDFSTGDCDHIFEGFNFEAEEHGDDRVENAIETMLAVVIKDSFGCDVDAPTGQFTTPDGILHKVWTAPYPVLTVWQNFNNALKISADTTPLSSKDIHWWDDCHKLKKSNPGYCALIEYIRKNCEDFGFDESDPDDIRMFIWASKDRSVMMWIKDRMSRDMELCFTNCEDVWP